MTDKIKPCPYCLDDCEVFVDSWFFGASLMHQTSCNNCLAKGSPKDSEEEAIEAHNRLSEQAEKLKQIKNLALYWAEGETATQKIEKIAKLFLGGEESTPEVTNDR